MRQKLKRSAAALLCLVILVQFSGLSLPVSAEPASEIWDGSVAASFAGGTGTEEDPYIIRTPQQLAYLAQQVNSGTSYEGNYFRQAADLLLNDTTDWERWGVSNDTKQRIAPANRWMPIGNDAAFFSGVYDGGGHTVSGMFVSFFGEARVSEVYHGLFGYVSGGTILNLNIAQSRVDNEGDPDVWGGKEYEAMELSCLGAVVGSIRGGTVSGCSNSGCVSGSGGFMNYIGGIAGCAENSTVSGCENTSHIHGTGEGVYAGGVAGQIMGCQLKGCSNFGAVDASGSSDELIGGLVGYAKNGTVIGCCNTGAISARCYNAYSGGLIGYSFGGVKIDCCYNSGMVSANGFSASAGGLVGVSMNPLTSDNSYNVGTVSCAANDIPKYGGIVGEFFGGEVRNCYYLDTCVAERSAQGTALTDTQMRMQ